MSCLTVWFEPDPTDDLGKLWMRVVSGPFAGSGFFWSYPNTLNELAERLAAYPLGKPVEEKWGYEKLQGADVVLGLRIAPVGNKGDLVVETLIADYADLQQRVSVNFATSYAELDLFRQRLGALAAGTSDEACLTGNETTVIQSSGVSS